MNYVTSESDIARALGINGSASFGNGIFSADASVQYLSSSNVTQYSSYLMVTSTNKNAQQLLTRYHLTSDAKKALKQGLPQFVALCGDQFVSGVVTGGSLSAVISASSKTTAEQIDANATLHAAGWGGSVDISTQSKLQTYLSNGRLDIKVIRQGPAEPSPTGTVADFVAYAQSFPQKVAVGSTSAWVISYVTQTYDEIYQKWDAPPSQIAFFNAEGPYISRYIRIGTITTTYLTTRISSVPRAARRLTRN